MSPHKVPKLHTCGGGCRPHAGQAATQERSLPAPLSRPLWTRRTAASHRQVLTPMQIRCGVRARATSSSRWTSHAIRVSRTPRCRGPGRCVPFATTGKDFVRRLCRRRCSRTFARSASTGDAKAQGSTPGPSSISRSATSYKTARDRATSRRAERAMRRFLRISIRLVGYHP